MSTAKQTAKGNSKPKSTKPVNKSLNAAGVPRKVLARAKYISCSIRKVLRRPGFLGSN